MNRHASFRAITRRALRVNYVSPSTCVAVADLDSGSSDGSESIIDFAGFSRTAGPTLSISQLALTDFLLEWSEVPKAGFYRVFRSTSQSGPFTLVQDFVGVTTYQDTPPGPGEFFYQVTAIEPKSGETSPSNTVSGFASIEGGPSVLGFTLWLAPESSVTTDAEGTTPAVADEEIRYWQDLSGHNNHAVFVPGMLAGSGPKYEPTTLNGLRLVTFGDSNTAAPGEENRTGLLTPSMTLTDGVTVFTVARFRAPSVGVAELRGSVFSYDSILQARKPAGTNKWSSINNITAVENEDPSVVGVFSPHVMAFRFEFGVAQSLFRDGALIVTSADASSTAPAAGKIAVGFREDSATEGHLSALVAEKIVYPWAMTDAEILAISADLATKYNL